MYFFKKSHNVRSVKIFVDHNRICNCFVKIIMAIVMNNVIIIILEFLKFTFNI